MNKAKRLIEYFVPENYDLDLVSDSKELFFKGKVIIKGVPGKKLKDKLYLHSVDLDIENVKVNGKAQEFELKPENEELEIALDKKPGKNIKVEIEYSGNTSEEMTGIYQCPYVERGKGKMLVGTQFESHYARKALPSVDEPEAKATFNVKLGVLKSETALSNMPAKKTSTKGKYKVFEFGETPKMSTYLLAFAHGDIKSLEATTKNGTLVRTWSTPNNVEYTKHSLEVGVKTLEYLDDYFAIPYPLEKCDMIGLPNFSAGAMENWGLITYREASFFVDPENTSQGSLENVTMTVIHELVHQWFGNLVTMKWWNDLWLNEGFASFMPYLVMDHLYPEWNVWTQFLLDDFFHAQGLDALKNSHPIEVEVNHPDEIRTIFDSISYDKGASVLNMLHSYLGATDFRDGLRLYLERHKYGNTVTNDLWKALEEVSSKPVSKFMKKWTSETGFPVVEVSQDIKTNTINFEQTRFMINSRERKKAKDKTIWPVPISIAGVNDTFQLEKAKDSWTPPTSGFINQKINSHHDSFFMTAYEQEHIQAIANQVAQGKLSVRDRIGLLSDTFELSKAGYMKTEDALNLLSNYRDETNPFVWDVMAGDLAAIRLVMNSDSLRDNMKKFIKELVKGQLSRLGWDELENEPYFDTIMRPTVLSLGVFSEHEETIKEAKKRFKAMKSPEDEKPNVRGAIYQAIAQESKESDYKKVLKFYLETDSPQEKVKLTSALCSFNKESLYKKSLEMIKGKDVKSQDVPYWIAYIFINRYAREDAWKWFKQEWGWMKETFSSDVALLSHLPQYAGRVFSDDKFAKEYEKFFKDNTPNGMERQILQTIESIEWKSDWKKRDLKSIEAYFKSAQ